MSANEDAIPQPKRLTKAEREKQVERLSQPRQEMPIHDPFEVCPTRHISAEEMGKMTERLYTQSLERKAASLAEAEQAAYGGGAHSTTDKSRKLTADQQEQAVTRLYNDSMQRKEESMKELRQRHLYHAPQTKNTVPLDTFVQHMYTDRLEAKKATAQRLNDLYLAPTEIRTGKISKAQAEESANRLSTTKSAS